MNSHEHHKAREGTPVRKRDIQIVGRRVVKIQTQCIAESVWVASGHVSDPLPTERWLSSPQEFSSCGSTEQEAIERLKRRIRDEDKSRAGD